MDPHKSQEKLLDFLKDSDSYPHRPSNININQTHASVLAIVPPFVYKIKKQVDLGFMDFRSLPARKENCQKEYTLNRRLCPELYLDIVPISVVNDKIAFGSEGTIIDYALKMKFLPDGYFLDQLVDEGLVNSELLNQVLLVLKNFYSKQPNDPSIQAFGDPAHIKKINDEIFQTLTNFIGETAEEEALEAVINIAHLYIKKNKKLFEKRVLENKIKDCHGDLHLEHIHIYKNKICIYDCIEFSDRFRYIDIAADIAFLAMDLDFHHRPDLSQYVIRKFSEIMDDPELFHIIDFYKTYRACVRAKIESITSRQEEVSEDQRNFSRMKARKYLSLAIRYSVLGSSPSGIIICGNVGSGKSTIAKRLAELLEVNVVSSDMIRKELEGLPLYKRTDQSQREKVYSRESSEKVYQNLLDQSLGHVRKNQNVIIDATFSNSSFRNQFIQKFKEQKIPFYFVELQISDEKAKERLAEREVQKNVISDARLEDFEKLKAAYEPLKEVSHERLITVSSDYNFKKSIKFIFKELSQRKTGLL
jgi:uncharacterized protein